MCTTLFGEQHPTETEITRPRLLRPDAAKGVSSRLVADLLGSVLFLGGDLSTGNSSMKVKAGSSHERSGLVKIFSSLSSCVPWEMKTAMLKEPR